MQKIKNKITAHLALGKIGIILPVTFSAILGYALASAGFAGTPPGLILGTFLIAFGSAALNQVQEHRLDAMMPRTANRPLVTGRVTVKGALIVVFISVFIGLASLYVYCGVRTMLLGVLAIIAYNGFYTPLKRITAFAAVPGSIIGALPPAMGWAAAGGSLADPVFLSITVFFMMWQIPHFWLLLLSWGDEYAKAGMPSLLKIFTPDQLARITFTWILATVLMGLMLPIYMAVPIHIVHFLIVLASLWIVVTSVQILKVKRTIKVSRAVFRNINIYTLFVVIVMVAGRMI